VNNQGIIHPIEEKERPRYEVLGYVEKGEWSSSDKSWLSCSFCHKRGHDKANCWDLHLKLVLSWFLKQKEDMKCKTSLKRDEQVEEKTKTSSSRHSSSLRKKHGSKDNKGRYKPHSNSLFDFEPHDPFMEYGSIHFM